MEGISGEVHIACTRSLDPEMPNTIGLYQIVLGFHAVTGIDIGSSKMSGVYYSTLSYVWVHFGEGISQAILRRTNIPFWQFSANGARDSIQ